jgi:hypothetical protein
MAPCPKCGHDVLNKDPRHTCPEKPPRPHAPPCYCQECGDTKPAHVERRAGQRWKAALKGTASTWVVTLTQQIGNEWCTENAVWSGFSGSEKLGNCRFTENMWSADDWTMTLLPDAPAPVVCDCSKRGLIIHRAECPMAKPVVAKSATTPPRAHDFSDPKCEECTKMAPNVRWRVTRHGREQLCDICMVRQEEEVEDLAGQEPRRIPPAVASRPGELLDRRIACDYWEDCL